MKFKTNAKCAGCSSAIKRALSVLKPSDKWELDLTSPDRILSCSESLTESDAEEVIKLVQKAGFMIERC